MKSLGSCGLGGGGARVVGTAWAAVTRRATGTLGAGAGRVGAGCLAPEPVAVAAAAAATPMGPTASTAALTRMVMDGRARMALRCHAPPGSRTGACQRAPPWGRACHWGHGTVTVAVTPAPPFRHDFVKYDTGG